MSIGNHYPEDIAASLKALQQHFDPYPQRKGRIFDYLIALYGERYPDTLHRAFNPYYSDEELEQRLLALKQRYIRHIATITNQRGVGDNLFDHNHRGGYSERLGMLLGLMGNDNLQLSGQSAGVSPTITEYLLNVVSDKDYRSSDIGKTALFELQSAVELLMTSLPEPNKLVSLSIQQKRQLRASVYAISGQTLPESLLQFGVDHRRYRILQNGQEGEFRLLFDMGGDDPQRWLYIAKYNRQDKLVRFCEWLQAWLIELNQRSETLYVVEPLTLRSVAADSLETNSIDDLANRLCIVLPGFSARHQNSLFQQQAEN
ncbi:response regulator receiver (CheY-like) modulated diguanylate cyclase/phosphodiesterase [Vibrio maritimus]|uniref:Response regulator receiver (CheY-like) modulated diguanylate cyclase/phosphodiesterase n=1 Tax=Vibrio maritimus TaxID=990268 RepID=A0A090T4H2_9VIBR|nr:response regulator receiver (CheY-like) modulated diguanylate cyclase/phosphodiesterase [Vibrio maritimus]